MLDKEPNDNLAGSQSLETGTWALASNPNIGDTNGNTSTSIPHITLLSNDTTDPFDSYDYFSFVVTTANSRAIFDIDFASDDTILALFDSTGKQLRSNNDAAAITDGDQGSTTTEDAYLEYTFATPGTYYIKVAKPDLNETPDAAGSAGTGLKEKEPNNTFGTAQSVDSTGWTLWSNPNIGDTTTNTSTTIPHVSVFNDNTSTTASFDFYSFNVTTANSKGIFDIDGGSVDTIFSILNSAGAIIASNNDSPTANGQGGSTSTQDPYLEFTFATPGKYYVRVAQVDPANPAGTTGLPITAGSDYVLNISLANHELNVQGAPLPAGTTYELQVSVQNHEVTKSQLGNVNITKVIGIGTGANATVLVLGNDPEFTPPSPPEPAPFKVMPGLYRSTTGRDGNYLNIMGPSSTLTRGTDPNAANPPLRGPNLPNAKIWDIVQDPTNANRLYAAVGEDESTGETEAGVYRSEDGGATWFEIDDFAGNDEIRGLIQEATNVKLAITKDPGQTANHRLYLGIVDSTGFNMAYLGWYDPDADTGMVSGDADDGWTKMADIVTPTGDDTFTRGRSDLYFTFAADPNDPNVIYLGADVHTPTTPRYLTTATNPCPPRGNDFCAFDYTGRLFRGLASIDPASTNPRQWVHITNSNVITGASGWTNPANAGGTFHNSSPHSGSRNIAFDSLGHMIEVDDGGIYRRTLPTRNSGDWFSLNGNMQSMQFHDIAYDSNSNVIFGGALNTGTTQQVTSGSMIWKTILENSGGDVAVDDTSLADQGLSIRYVSSELLSDKLSLNPLFTLGGTGQLFQRLVFDQNNNLVNFPGVSGAVSMTFVGTGSQVVEQFRTPIELNAIDQRHLVIGGNNYIYESFDRGQTVRQINLGKGIKQLAYGGYRTINGTPVANQDVLWVVAGVNVFYRETGVATSPLPSQGFANIHFGDTDETLDVVMDPDDYRTAYVIDQNNIFMTTDAGATWKEISGGGKLGNLIGDFRALNYIRRSPGEQDQLMVGGLTGVARIYIEQAKTADNFNGWEKYGLGMPNAPIRDIDYDENDDALVVASFGRGAWITNATDIPAGAKIVTRFVDNAATPNDIASINESAGANFGRIQVRREDSAGNPLSMGNLKVQVTLNDQTEVRFANGTTVAEVTILDGQSVAYLNISTVANGLATDQTNDAFTTITDGTQMVVASARATVSFGSVSDVLDVTDNDGPKYAVVTLPNLPPSGSLPENTGPNATIGTVTLSAPSATDVTVYLFSSDPSEATVPTSIVVPAGKLTATFPLNTVDETISDGIRKVTITAALEGFTCVSGNSQQNVDTGVATVNITPSPGGTGSGAEDVNRLGDRSPKRAQGQLLLDSNVIRDVSAIGIKIEAGTRNVGSNLPNPGAAISFPTVNNERLVPGTVVMNNVIYNVGQAGIHFSGDPNSAGGVAVVPFGRIVNNTVYGGATPQAVGIQIANNASPTLTNNLIANTSVAIDVDASSNTTVIGTTLFHNNSANGPTGSNPIIVPTLQPIFVEPQRGNFYPISDSPAIDSSINTLPDRFGYVNVKSPLGIPESNIVAPERDAYGQLRVDDAVQPSQPGLGINIYKDRGAVERSDELGPFASLINPADNDSLGLDLDPQLAVVQLESGILTQFELLLSDGLGPLSPFEGLGIDDRTVSPSSVLLTRDGQLLREGVDYAMGYNATSNLLRFTPLAGIWPNNSSYVITLNNIDRDVIEAPAGNEVADGDQFKVGDSTGAVVTFEYETGYVVNVPKTYQLIVPVEGSGTGGIVDGDRFTIGDGVTTVVFEFDRNNNVMPGTTRIPFTTGMTQDQIVDLMVSSIQASKLKLAPRNLGNGQVHLGTRANYTVTLPTNSNLSRTGVTSNVKDGDGFTIKYGTKTFGFEFEDIDAANGVSPGRIPINFQYSDTNDEIAKEMARQIATTTGLDLQNAADLGNGIVQIGGTTQHVLDLTKSPNLVGTGAPGVTPAISITVPDDPKPTSGGPTPPPGAGSLITDGESFSITLAGVVSTFEFDNNFNVVPGNIAISYGPNTTQDALALAIVNVVTDAGIALQPTYVGKGVISLNESAAYQVNFNTAPSLQVQGIPGGAVPINITPVDDPIQIAALISVAINDSSLIDVNANVAGGDRVFLDGAQNVSGLNSSFLSGIKDRAGNLLKPNNIDGSTRFTILVGYGVDYGDAPTSYGTTGKTSASHKIIPTMYLGNLVDPEGFGQASTLANGDDIVSLDDEDGVTFTNSLARGGISTATIVASTAGKLDAFIDFNIDGDFDDADEKILSSYPLNAGSNNVQFAIPSTMVLGSSYARFRFSSTGGLDPTGAAADGEVEDYRVSLVVPPWQNPLNPYDVSNDGVITPLDPLIQINFYNKFYSGTNLFLPNPPPYSSGGITIYPNPGPGEQAYYMDFDGDGQLTPSDMIQIINYLNNPPPDAEGEAADGGEGESAAVFGSIDVTANLGDSIELTAAPVTGSPMSNSRNATGGSLNVATGSLASSANIVETDYRQAALDQLVEEFVDSTKKSLSRNEALDDFFARLGS